MVRIFAFIFLAVTATPLSAQTSNCSAIPDKDQRLACFDSAAKTATPAPKQTATGKTDPTLAAARAAVARKLKDPGSATFDQLVRKTAPNTRGEPTDVLCGTVNAKNSYGGFTGAKPFVYLLKIGDAYIVENNGDDTDAFVATAIYKRFCLGKG